MSRLISRDPFAREELHRETVPGGLCTLPCRNCGSWRKTRSGRPVAYRYYVETDGGRRHHLPGEFCSVGCCRSFHGA